MKQKIRAVIFDMYETLVTQFCSPLYYGTQMAQDLGLTPEAFLPGWRSTEEARATGKQTFEEVMEGLMKAHHIYTPERHRQIVERRVAFQADCFNHLHPEILPMLGTLREKNIRIGLITNCFSEEARLIRESELYPLFDAPCLSWEVGIRKPDPTIYHVCLEKLGIPAEHCLYVGDGGSRELETARSLGIQAVQATWYRKADFEHLQAAIRPDFPQINDPAELIRLVTEHTRGCEG
jgi:putative hydrolase of the HAD superfamily